MKIETTREQLMAAVNAIKLLPQKVGESDLVIRIAKSDDATGALTLLAQADAMAIEVKVLATSIDCDSPFAVCSRYFNSFVSAMPDGALTISAPSQRTVKLAALGSRSSFVLSRANSDAKPFSGPSNTSHIINVCAGDFNRALSRVSYAACADVARRALVGVHLVYTPSIVTLVATDGRRISVDCSATIDTTTPTAVDYTISLPLVRVLQRMLQSCDPSQKIRIMLDDSVVDFAGSDWRLRGSIVDEKYPDWLRVIPSLDTVDACITVDRELMLLQLQCAMLAAVDRDDPVLLTIGKDELAIVCKNDANTSSQVMPCTLECGKPFESRQVAINPYFLKDALNCIPNESARINLNALSPSPILIRAGLSDEAPNKTADWKSVVMPLRRN